MADASIIYKLSQTGLVNDGIIELEEKTLIYKAFVTKDMVFTIYPTFEATEDYTFVLELTSDGLHLIKFNEKIKPVSQLMPINRGVTKMYFSKKLGVPYYEVTINRLDAPEPVLLTPNNETAINSNFQVTAPQGCNCYPVIDIIRDSYVDYFDCRELQFKFETSVCVDFVNYLSRYDSYPMGEFILKGSNDGINWTTLLYRIEEVIYGKIYTDVKGCFRYFNLKIGYNCNENKPAGVTLWGTQIDNNESEITCVTPYMASAETSFAKITASGISEGDILNVTNESANSYVFISPDADGNSWVKYELNEPAVVNVVRYFVNSRHRDRQASWFKLEASNDDKNWDLLLERKYNGTGFVPENGSELFFDLNNENPYRYFRFTKIASNSDNLQWPFYGFKLYHRLEGKHNFYKVHPYFKSANQDGYEVSSSSEYNSSRASYFCFDNNLDTRWESAGNKNEWICIKLPSPQILNAVKIVARRGGEYSLCPTSFNVQGSANGDTWTDLLSIKGIGWNATTSSQMFRFENDQAFSFYRLLCVENSGGSAFQIGELEFGRMQFEPKRKLSQTKNLVPFMSADEQDGFVLTASSVYKAYNPFKAFNGVISDSSSWTANGQSGWIQVELPTPDRANVLKMAGGFSKEEPDSFILKASNDGINYDVLLDSGALSWNHNEEKIWNFTNENAYKFYRVEAVNSKTSYVTISEIVLQEETFLME